MIFKEIKKFSLTVFRSGHKQVIMTDVCKMINKVLFSHNSSYYNILYSF